MREPNLLFLRSDLPPDEREFLQDINDCIKRLAALRPSEISSADSDLHFSKVAWKFKTLVAALLYRLVALCDGAVLALNARSTLTAFLAARALLETSVVIGVLVLETRRALDAKDIDAVDKLAYTGVFATRDREQLRDHPEIEAVNILTFIRKLEMRVPDIAGLEEMYGGLCEWCHPNSAGGHFMFGSLDTSTATVTYREEQEPELNLSLIHSALVMLHLAEGWLAELLGTASEIGELHAALEGPLI